jgi:YHS domain-containing protein
MNEIVLDPVCGKEVDPLRARAVGIFGGVTYYFCSAECKTRFRDPRKAPRESTRDIVTRPARKTGETPIFEAPSPTESAQAQAADEAAPAPVPYARSRPRRSEPDPSVKVDPSPSVQEEVEALKSGAGRAWLVVLALFALAGVVLFFAFHR